MTQPATVKHAEQNHVLTGFNAYAVVIRDGQVIADYGEVGRWQPPLSWRVGYAVRNFLAELEAAESWPRCAWIIVSALARAFGRGVRWIFGFSKGRRS